ncbi:MAG: ATP-binding protein [Desulfobulbus sp.]
MLQILQDPNNLRSALVTTQLPVEQRHEQVNDSTTAFAILDDLVHNAHTLQLKGGSIRKSYHFG